MKRPWQRRETPSPEVLELEESLRQTRLSLAQAYAGFNSAADGELVEAFVYEILSLQTRYSYLLRQRKALGGERPEPGRAEGKRRSEDGAAPVRRRAPAELPAGPILPVA